MKYIINLFPKKEKGLVEKAMYFVFNYLRYILVITQIIVIAVFFYRFKIDQEIVDLKDVLSQKQEIVEISKPLIEEVSAVEKKTAIVQDIIKRQNRFADAFQYVMSIFPEKLTLDKLTIEVNGDFNFTGTTSNPDVVKQFYNKLKKDKRFASVELKNIKKELLDFSFSMELNKYSVVKK